MGREGRGERGGDGNDERKDEVECDVGEHGEWKKMREKSGRGEECGGKAGKKN